ncbi:MAG: flagellar basal body-associated FliL family protein [Methylobacterium sp.]|nr:flagellar basal body-associated FliL family protein [Methylobacterium sp.]
MVANTAKPDEIPADGKAAGSGGRKKLIVISVVSALLAAGAGGGYYFWQRSKAAEVDKAAQLKKKAFFFDLPEITVNLASAPGQERPAYLRLKLALEVDDQKIIAEIQPLMPRVIDSLQVFLRELRPTDLEGSAGLYRLKEELVRRVNASIYPARIEAILFKDVLVQ